MKTLQKYILFLLYSFVCLIVAFIFLHIVFPFKVEDDYSRFITDRNDQILHAYLNSSDKWRMKTDLDEITPTLKKAIVFKEDKYFYQHFGINPIAIGRAAFNNIIHGKRTSGASTITMQVARLLEPKKRTYLNKLIEMFRAIQLEIKFSKDEILQLYLNLVPYGGNIEGVKAASVMYLNKSPGNLSLAEITALSIIPNRPTSLQPGKNNTLIVKERNKWLSRFKDANLFNDEIIQDALEEPFNAYRHNAPKKAPHFSRRIINNHSKSINTKTTLNIELQEMFEEQIKNYSNKLSSFNIHNAAVILIDNKTSEVLAYVGSSDFYSSKDGGQVDGIQAIRSPGSTLKPFVYAKGFDSGVISPKYKLTDVPVTFSGYSPTNFDDQYRGLVSVDEALAQSLNVPAVKVLEKIGSKNLVQQLEQMGFDQISKDKNKLGLAVALGGCGVALDELSTLYAAFANNGIYKPLLYTMEESEKDQMETEMVSPEAAFMITDILTELKRPDFPQYSSNIANIHNIAWKTGTSYGRKDAWSIGYNHEYTLGVWVGNFSAEGVPELTGADMAAPLLFNLFSSLESNAKNWYAAPDGLKYRWVCSETGMKPSVNCEHQIMDYFIPLVTHNKTCNHMKQVMVNVEENVSYCQHCISNHPYKINLTENYPSDLITYYESENIPYDKAPKHNPLCEKMQTNNGLLSIVSPLEEIKYLLQKEDNTEIMLQSHVSNDVEEVFWYVNDAFYEKVKSSESAFFEPLAGRNKITCVDDKGRTKTVNINVQFL